MVDKGTLDRCLTGISFPADRDEIADCVAGNSCPRDVVAQLQALRAGTFRSENEMLCDLGDPRYCS